MHPSKMEALKISRFCLCVKFDFFGEKLLKIELKIKLLVIREFSDKVGV